MPAKPCNAIHKIAPRFTDLLMVSEIRTVAPDDFWLSMNYRRPSLAIHFAFNRDWPAVSRVLPIIEEALAPFSPRPHWGKMFTMPGATIQAAYPRLSDFRALAKRLDPRASSATPISTNISAKPPFQRAIRAVHPGVI